jgi:hypothetical protein
MGVIFMSIETEGVLESYVGKEVKYKGVKYMIEEIKNTSTGIKMIFMKDSNERYFEPSYNLFVDEIIKIRR